MNRRLALKHMTGLVSAMTAGLIGGSSKSMFAATKASDMDFSEAQAAAAPAPAAPAGPYTLPPLPYAYDALEPYFDAETMHLHHDKHHQSYVDKLNIAVNSQPQAAASPQAQWKNVNDLVANLDDVPESIRTAVRNQGGGHANHSFWWTSLAKPGTGGSAPTGELAKAIDAKFSSLSGFQEKLTTAGAGVFGSGWAWLVSMPGGTLEIQTTPNQDSPLTVGHTPILGIDVWEHAYYLKYKNKRPDYIKAYFSVVNWDAASQKFASIKKA